MTEKQLTEAIKSKQDEINETMEVAGLMAGDIRDDIFGYDFQRASRDLVFLSNLVGDLITLQQQQLFFKEQREASDAVP